MTPVAAPSPVETDLAALFRQGGAVPVDVPLLQPAEPYLDTTGEALRRRIFLTRGEAGEVLCLRPDFTIPVCLAHIRAGEALPRRYSYLGPVFRQGRTDGSELRQAGLEDLGDENRARADAQAVADALAALDVAGFALRSLDVVLGDQALFEAFLAGLGLAGSWQRRLVRTFGDDAAMRGALDRLSRPDDGALANLDPNLRAIAHLEGAAILKTEIEMLKEAGGLPPHSGRSATEIAERLIEKVAFAETTLEATALERLRGFLAVDCALDRAVERLRDAAGADIDLGPALAFLQARNAALAARGIDLGRLRYRAAFGRAIDYYTGLVFEASLPGAAEPLAGGGRYDRLLTYLGAPAPVPAVGFSLWLDRIRAATP